MDVTREAQRVTREMSRESVLATYEFDSDVQAFRGAKATVNDKRLGRTMTAGESIHLTSITDFNMALAAIQELERAVRAGRARTAPVPGVIAIEAPELLSNLYDSMVEAFRKSDPAVVLNLPDAAQNTPFAIDGSGTVPGIEAFDIGDLRSELTAMARLATINVDELANQVLCDPQDLAETIRVWPYLAASITVDGHFYLFENERWYRTPAGWLATVNARVDGCSVIDDLPSYTHANENEYNIKALAPHLAPAVSLDKHLTRVPGFGRSGIEILDVLATGKRAGDSMATLRFFAVKRGLLSQNMTHLFTQVKTAVDSLQDATIRAAFLDVVRDSSPPSAVLKLANDLLGAGRLYDTSRIEIVIAIVGDWRVGAVSASIPVLGRAGLQQTIVRASALGHPVFIARVPTAVATAEKKTTTKAKTKTVKIKKGNRNKKVGLKH